MFAAILVYMFLAGYRYITEGREKRYLRNVFEHYMDPDVISAVLDSPEGLKLGGEKRHLAILFADIVSFTKRAEKTTPEDLLALLNTYMTSMIDVILKTGGVVDKLMGDGIMAFWGAPNDLDNPSRSAIDCALKMLDNLHELQNQRSALRGSRHRHRHRNRRRRRRQPRRRKAFRLFRHRRHCQLCLAAGRPHPPLQGASARQSRDLY